MKLTERNSSWHSGVSEPHPSFILLYDSEGLTGTDEGFVEPESSLISKTLLKKKKMKLQNQVSWAQDTKGS